MTERFATLVDLCETSCERFAARPLFGTRGPAGWQYASYGDFRALVAQCRTGLSALGLRPGEKVALVSNNRVEWAACAYATYGLSAAVVSMYEAQRPTEWEFILRDSGAAIAFVANEAIARRLESAAPGLPALRAILRFDVPREHPASFAGLIERGAAGPSVAPVVPDKTATANLIYTSGTTGNPKGVILSHGNIVSNVNAMHDVFLFEPEDRSLSFLPWAHAFGQMELHIFLSMGCSLALSRDAAKLIDEIAEVEPTVLVAVPQVFSRLYAAVWDQLRERPRAVQGIVRKAIEWSTRRNRGEPLSAVARAGLRIVDALIFSKVRARFGGRLKYVICGGAALGPEVAHFIDAIGVTVYEGYGLTETSPIVSANCPAHRRLGSAGKVLPGVTVIVDLSVGAGTEGEIVVYGPNVMRGYHDRPEESGSLLPDGGFRTGDLGHFDADGYLYITGRIKDQFKLENGKYVMPAPLEEKLKTSPYVANVLLYGDNRPYCVALILIDLEHIRRWAAERGFEVDDPTHDERVLGLVRDEIALQSAGFRRFEIPRAFALAEDEFTTQNGMLTPTLKLKRLVAVSKYKSVLDALYGAPPAAAFAPRATPTPRGSAPTGT